MKVLHRLQPTSWLAERLNLSIATIERLRTQKSPELPPHIAIGRSIRYCEAAVEQWLRERLQP
jgi:predicted DNA-binding transcriptional regulator AlpA